MAAEAAEVVAATEALQGGDRGSVTASDALMQPVVAAADDRLARILGLSSWCGYRKFLRTLTTHTVDGQPRCGFDRGG
jgi:hypothetical protein